MSTHSPQRLIIFDTTLRDGEQSPGCSMSLPEKVQMARALAHLGVDVIEAGFPAASSGDFEAVRAVAAAVPAEVSTCALARCREADIHRAAAALEPAAHPRLHTFLATSPVHREHKLGMDEDQVIEAIRRGVALAKSLCADVEFSAEDASRTEPEFLARAVQAAIEAGAHTINLPDTVGYAEPREYGRMFRLLRRTVPGIENVVLSTHCHDDLGLAVANSLAGVRAGARQVECTINGIGERAGNCALEEVVMAVRTRRDRYRVTTGVQSERLCRTSRLLTQITGTAVPPNKAIVGHNAFAHEAGIHQHGVLRHRATYEIMHPHDVGADGSRMVLGKHSGRHALRQRVDELGQTLDDDAFEALFVAFKALADRKKHVDDDDLEALIVGGTRAPGPWQLRSLSTTAGTGTAHACASVQHTNGEECREAAAGDGPIDATFRAIARATGFDTAHLRDYSVHSVTVGEDAQGRVAAECEYDGQTVRGHGVSTDIVEASARAFVDAINRLAAEPAPANEPPTATAAAPRTTAGVAAHGARR